MTKGLRSFANPSHYSTDHGLSLIVSLGVALFEDELVIQNKQQRGQEGKAAEDHPH